MNMPHTYTDRNDTGCCAVPNIAEWDGVEVQFENKRFIRMYTRSFLFVPLNMSKVMSALQRSAETAGATMPPTDALILSRDISPWKAEQLYAVTKPIDGADNVTLNGSYLCIVNEGPYKNTRQWYEQLQRFAKERNKTIDATYFFYTTCPKCAKHYGKNYVLTIGHIA